jgi:sterol desaturase/sphingolipid hydroxylase (fatty acid hydroxylase superfamily)
MNSLRAYFSSEHDFHRVLLLVISISIFWIIERFAAINFDYRKWKHAFTNGLFVFTAAPVQFLLGLALVKTINWDGKHHFGFFQDVPGFSNPWILLLATIIFLDFFEYVYHILMHKIKSLWMFHLVHHSDPVVDASTTLREHPGETLVRLSASVFWVFLAGAPFWIILFRQFIQISANVFVHSNFRLNEKVDKYIGWIFITPNLHHVHHHFKRPYTDSNYGDILSIWDRLFGTFRRLEVGETIFGIDTCMNPEENSKIKNLMMIPFDGYRPPQEENGE